MNPCGVGVSAKAGIAEVGGYTRKQRCVRLVGLGELHSGSYGCGFNAINLNREKECITAVQLFRAEKERGKTRPKKACFHQICEFMFV